MGTYVRLVAPEDRPPDTREAVRALLDQGKCAAAVARELGVAKSTVCYHRRRLGHDIDERCNRRYDWDEVQRYHDLGHSVRACRARFGFSSKTWYDAVQRGALSPRPAAAPIERYLVKDRAVSRCHLKRRLIAEGHKRLECEACGISEWRGQPLFMSLHHINGDGLDNRLENLAILCPNCHTQTPNFGSLNKGRQAA